MGINQLFDKEADLSGLLSKNTKPLYVNYAVHKAIIEINEVLTEASAATGSIL